MLARLLLRAPPRQRRLLRRSQGAFSRRVLSPPHRLVSRARLAPHAVRLRPWLSPSPHRPSLARRSHQPLSRLPRPRLAPPLSGFDRLRGAGSLRARHRTPGSSPGAGFERRLHRAVPPDCSGGSRSARPSRPPASGVWTAFDPTFLVDLCNRHSLRAQPRSLRSPTGRARGPASRPAVPSTQHPQLALGLEETSGRGWGLARRIDRRIQVAPRLPPLRGP